MFEDSLEMLTDLTASIGAAASPLTSATLEFNFRDDNLSNMIVMLLRFVTSAEVQARRDFFEPFIMGTYEVDVSAQRLRCYK